MKPQLARISVVAALVAVSSPARDTASAPRTVEKHG